MLLQLDSETGAFDLTSDKTVLTYTFTDPHSLNPGRLCKAYIQLGSLASEAQTFTYWVEQPIYAGLQAQEFSVSKPVNSLADFGFWTEDILVVNPTSGSLKIHLRLSTGADTNIDVTCKLYDISGYGVLEYFALDHLVSNGSSVPSVADGTFLDQIMRRSGGMYSRADHSLEALAGHHTDIRGSSFSSTSDSLRAIRNAIDVLLAPRVETAVSIGQGFLGDVISRIRQYADEPGLDAAHTNADLLRHIQDSWTEIFREICMVADWKQWVSFTLTIDPGTSEYILPPNFDQILALERIDSQGLGYVLYEYIPRNRLSPCGPGWYLDHNTLKFEPGLSTSGSLRLLYRPTGQIACHEGTATAATSTTITFPQTPSVGSLDTRKNAYAGYIVRLLSATYDNQAFYQQERIIKAYDESTRTCTVPAWSPVPSGTIIYEVLPQSADLFRKVIALKVARLLAGTRGNSERATLLNTEYHDSLRSLRSHFANMNGRVGKSMTRNVRRPLKRL